jgi:HlyD family secretion protein
VTPKQDVLRVTVSATGTIEPEYTVEIKSKASGEVQAVNVQEGERVKAGAVLVKLDPIVERRRVSQAQAELRMAIAHAAAARQKTTHAKSQLKRDQELMARGLVSRDAVDNLRKEVGVLTADAMVSAAQIAKARESLQEAKDRFIETEIKSPISGTVLQRLVQPGQIVASGTNTVGGGTALLKVADLSQLFVRVKIDEAEVAKIRPGQPVRITADALSNQSFAAKVVRVAAQGTVESNVTVFEVLVAIDKDGSGSLRPMMSANVEVLVAERADAVLLPQAAVQRDRDGAFVVLEGGKKQRVKVGATVKGMTEIQQGLAARTRVQLPAGKHSARPDRAQAGQGNTNARGMRQMMGGRS